MFGTYEADKPVKIPTFTAYLKENKGKKCLTQLFPIEIVWFPVKFNNYTLQTHAFRLSISNQHPLFLKLNEFCEPLSKDAPTPVVRIKILDPDKGTFELIPCEKKRCVWSKLGDAGLKANEI